MIQLFIALPAVELDENDPEDVYLKTLDRVDEEEILQLWRKAIKAVKMVKYEDGQIFYDNRRFSALIHAMTDDGQSPRANQLLQMMSDWNDVHLKKEPFVPCEVRGKIQHDGIVCAFLNRRNAEGDNIVDLEAIKNPPSIYVKDQYGREENISVLSCSDTKIYPHFVKYRELQRVLDPAYAKHSETEKKGKRGIVISGSSYSDEEAEMFLKWAVGEKGKRRLFFWDRKKSKLIIFFDENGTGFHVYDVPEDAESYNAEVQKIWKDGGRDLYDVVMALSKIIP